MKMFFLGNSLFPRLDMILQVGGVLTNIVNDWIFDFQREQIAIKEGDGTLKLGVMHKPRGQFLGLF